MVTTTLDRVEETTLKYVSDLDPGIRRIRAGSGHRYRRDDGGDMKVADRKRIDLLVIPPAWTDVWICADADGHIQATGRDKAGRKQYLYHPEWSRLSAEAKFDRLGDFGTRLPSLRKTVSSDLAGRGLTKRRVTALAVRLLDDTLIRVGNDRYAQDNGSYGLTTLTTDHVGVTGATVTFAFNGKSGVERTVEIRDRRLADLVKRCREVGGETLFSYRSGAEEGSIGSDDVNDYLREVTSETFTAKDFRTWGASAEVTAALCVGGLPGEPAETRRAWLDAIDVAAEVLGNTRAVCRASYVHPVIEDALGDGRLADAWRHSRRSAWMAREERTLLRLVTSSTQRVS